MSRIIESIKKRIGQALWRRKMMNMVQGEQFTRPWDLTTREYRKFGDKGKWDEHFTQMAREFEGVLNSLRLRDTVFHVHWLNVKNAFSIQIVTHRRNITHRNFSA